MSRSVNFSSSRQFTNIKAGTPTAVATLSLEKLLPSPTACIRQGQGQEANTLARLPLHFPHTRNAQSRNLKGCDFANLPRRQRIIGLYESWEKVTAEKSCYVDIITPARIVVAEGPDHYAHNAL